MIVIKQNCQKWDGNISVLRQNSNENVLKAVNQTLSLFQSGENRVPTPASAASAELHSQHAVPDVPPSDTKTEEQDYDIAIKTEPKMEVCLYIYILYICTVYYIQIPE